MPRFLLFILGYFLAFGIINKITINMKKKTIKKTDKKIVKKAIKKPAKKTVKKKIIKPQIIGKITHYFSDIKVAVVKLSKALKVGDEIRISGGNETNFKQLVKSIQFNHKDLKRAKPKQTIGMKVKEKVRESYKIFKA